MLRQPLLSLLSFFMIALGTASCGGSDSKAASGGGPGGGGKGGPGGPGGRPPLRADAFLVTERTLTDVLEIPGTVVANEATEIFPEVAGRITNLYFREGSYVNRGTLLAKLNDADLVAQRSKLSVQLKIAQANEARSAQLLAIQGISRQDYDLSLLNVSNIRADLDIINAQIAKMSVRAPFSGKLGLRLVSPGAYVSPSSAITSISQTSGLKIDFTVPEKYTSRLRTGQFVQFTVEGSNRNYSAKIIATESGVAEETRSLQVRGQLVGDVAGLTPGQFAKVALSFDPNTEALVIPTQAIIPQARGKKVYLMQGGKARFVDVTTGIRDSAFVEITGGLRAGDTVLVTGLLSLKPDADVQLGRIINQPRKP